MRFFVALVSLPLFAAAAQAQTAGPGSTAPAPMAAPAGVTAPATPPAASTTGPARSQHHAARESMQQRFDAANTTHDGKLTLEQAKAGMPRVARHFSAIDKDNKGYVTIDEIHEYNSAQHKAHQHHAG